LYTLYIELHIQIPLKVLSRHLLILSYELARSESNDSPFEYLHRNNLYTDIEILSGASQESPDAVLKYEDPKGSFARTFDYSAYTHEAKLLRASSYDSA
jgi:hypothetical protein